MHECLFIVQRPCRIITRLIKLPMGDIKMTSTKTLSNEGVVGPKCSIIWPWVPLYMARSTQGHLLLLVAISFTVKEYK